MREGVIGDVYMARGLCFKWRDTIGRASPESRCRPASTTTCGWARRPQRAFTQNRFHYNWHWYWDYGNGDIGNQGIHQMDIGALGPGREVPDQGQRHRRPLHVRRRPGDAQHPGRHLRVRRGRQEEDAGLRSAPLDHATTKPASATAVSRPEANDANTVGNIFYGSKGYMAIGRDDGYQTFLGKEQAPGPDRGAEPAATTSRNFIDVRAQPQAGGPERADRRRRHLHRAGAPGQHLLPAGPHAALRCRHVYLQGRRGSQRACSRAEYRAPFVVPKVV